MVTVGVSLPCLRVEMGLEKAHVSSGEAWEDESLGKAWTFQDAL